MEIFTEAMEIRMKALLNGQVIAERRHRRVRRYQYFPPAAVRSDLSREGRRGPKTDLECPHGVQFYDVVIEGARHGRAAWSYEAPQPRMQRVAGALRVLARRRGPLTRSGGL